MQSALEAPVTYRIPELPRGCGSWIVLDRNGTAVLEVFAADRETAERIDANRYAVVSSAEYLAHINGQPRAYSLAELAWQIMHMDYLDGRAPTLQMRWERMERVRSGEPVVRVRVYTGGGELYGPDSVVRITDKPSKPLPLDLDAIESALGEIEERRAAA